MDKIVIKDLEIFAYHGVLDFEKCNGQPFLVTAELFVNLREAGRTDSLDATINYAEVCEDIKNVMLDEAYDLIETVAEKIASMLLLKYEKAKAVMVSIVKPEAPIPMTFDTVRVELLRKRHIAYLSIGSNLGDKEGYLDYAVERLGKDAYITVNKVSSYIVTEPYGDVEQDDFLNGCLEIETLYTPEELLAVIHDIEAGAGRERLIHWGPRTLDIDILLYDSDIIMQEALTIPHVEMAKRTFVLEPLCEIAPFAYHPGYHRTVSELLEQIRQPR